MMKLNPLPPLLLPLTEREHQVLTLAAQGLMGKEIARELGISHRTIDIFRKKAEIRLGARTLGHAIALALTARIIRMPPKAKRGKRAARPEAIAGN